MHELKQTQKQWHEEFVDTILTQGLKFNECDKCVYIKNMKISCVLVFLYADDMIITSTKKILNSNFNMDQAHVILEI